MTEEEPGEPQRRWSGEAAEGSRRWEKEMVVVREEEGEGKMKIRHNVAVLFKKKDLL